MSGGRTTKSKTAGDVLDLLCALYDVERDAADLDAHARRRICESRSKENADTLRRWPTLYRQKATDGTAIA
jgi:hypothetical protein